MSLRHSSRRPFLGLGCKLDLAQECLGAGDGVGAARVVLKFSSNQTCVGAEEQAAFCKEMDALFRDRCRGYGTVSPSPLTIYRCGVASIPTPHHKRGGFRAFARRQR